MVVQPKISHGLGHDLFLPLFGTVPDQYLCQWHYQNDERSVTMTKDESSLPKIDHDYDHPSQGLVMDCYGNGVVFESKDLLEA